MPIVVKLDDLLHDRRMTLTDLADRVGMTLANLSILKTGKARAIRFSTLDAICEALSCQPGDILRFEAEQRRTRATASREKTESKLMKHHVTLTISSLLSILLFSLHWADEVARGLEPGTVSAFGGLLILAVWLCGTLVFAERRWGLVIILLGAILASGVPVLHMRGAGLVGGRIANSSGALLLGLDEHRAWRERDVVLRPLGACTVEPAAGPETAEARRVLIVDRNGVVP